MKVPTITPKAKIRVEMCGVDNIYPHIYLYCAAYKNNQFVAINPHKEDFDYIKCICIHCLETFTFRQEDFLKMMGSNKELFIIPSCHNSNRRDRIYPNITAWNQIKKQNVSVSKKIHLLHQANKKMDDEEIMENEPNLPISQEERNFMLNQMTEAQIAASCKTLLMTRQNMDN